MHLHCNLFFLGNHFTEQHQYKVNNTWVLHKPAALSYFSCGEEQEAVIEIKAFPSANSTRSPTAQSAHDQQTRESANQHPLIHPFFNQLGHINNWILSYYKYWLNSLNKTFQLIWKTLQYYVYYLYWNCLMYVNITVLANNMEKHWITQTHTHTLNSINDINSFFNRTTTSPNIFWMYWYLKSCCHV